MYEIIQGTAQKLRALYPVTEIYTERVKQDAASEYFRIQTVLVQDIPRMRGHLDRWVTLDIHYRNLTYRNLLEMQYTISENFRYLETSKGLLRSSGISHNIVDYVSHSVLTFKYPMTDIEAAETPMGSLEQEWRVLNGD